MKRLENKVAVITGGASGIGEATTRKYVSEGAAVSIWDLNEERGQKLCAELAQNGARCEFRKVNVASLSETTEQATAVRQTFGKIDILINNAGITRDATLLKMTEDQWDQVIDINLKGVFNCTRAVAPIMAEQGSGVILSTSSVVGLYGNFGQTNYVAAKSGVIGMTKVWARELGRKGIRVNAVAPGFIATDMIKTVPEKLISALSEKTPLGRVGQPEDIANAFVFLASEEAAFITGVVLSVDGGLIV
ncbi:MAG: 3-oxoacyl-ACP reductase FabG [Calditrichales bacterium]|nr:MAG: 3-oxoacyl-ACP reductase FabG [Calditrichales bacterium]